MKTWLLKLVASVAIKNAISYAYAVAVLTVDALRGILDGDNLSDDQRDKILAVLKAVTSVRDFIGKLKELFGAPVVPGLSASRALSSKLDDAVNQLNRLTNTI